MLLKYEEDVNQKILDYFFAKLCELLRNAFFKGFWIYSRQSIRKCFEIMEKNNSNMTELMKQHASLLTAVTVTQYVPTLHVTQNLFIFFVDVEKQEMTTFIH